MDHFPLGPFKEESFVGKRTHVRCKNNTIILPYILYFRELISGLISL